MAGWLEVRKGQVAELVLRSLDADSDEDSADLITAAVEMARVVKRELDRERLEVVA